MNLIMIQVPVTASLVTLNETLMSTLLCLSPIWTNSPLISLSLSLFMLMISKQFYILSLLDCVLPSHLIEIQLSLESKASLDSLPNKSYALFQVSCCGGLAGLPSFHHHVLSIAHLPSNKDPVLWGYVIWLYHLVPGSELSILSTPTLCIIFSNVNIPIEDLPDTQRHLNSWLPYFVTWFTSPPWSHHTVVGACYYQKLYNFNISNANISLSRQSLLLLVHLPKYHPFTMFQPHYHF